VKVNLTRILLVESGRRREENIENRVLLLESAIELRHLRYFVIVAENLHFGRAARALHIAQPPLSRQIRDLEYRLGVTLFDRGGRNVSLTDSGRVLLEESRHILREISVSFDRVRSAGQSGREVTISRHMTAGG
jgi:DNA-binding transcriptional LysR family regulator